MSALLLLVDDNPIQAGARQAILQRLGRVVVAPDGLAALERLKDAAFAKALSLLVTDHLMPGMNGRQLVERCRASLPALPVLVLSGLPEAESEYAGLGVVFRLKPFPPAELIRLVGELLKGSGP